jgi:hypothetical protein
MGTEWVIEDQYEWPASHQHRTHALVSPRRVRGHCCSRSDRRHLACGQRVWGILLAVVLEIPIALAYVWGSRQPCLVPAADGGAYIAALVN